MIFDRDSNSIFYFCKVVRTTISANPERSQRKQARLLCKMLQPL